MRLASKVRAGEKGDSMPNQLEFHPIANTFPLMEGDDYERFADDVAVQMHEPIVLFEDKILDGRNRYRACLDRGVEPVFTDYDGDDPVAFVVSKNLHRRHMDTSQRAMVATRIATLGHGQKKADAQICASAQDDAAGLLKVSRRTVQEARKVDESGSAQLVKAVERGDVSVSDAAAIIDLPKPEQDGAIQKVQQGEAGTLREATGRKPKPKKPLDTIREWAADGRLGKRAAAELECLGKAAHRKFIQLVNAGTCPADALKELSREPGDEVDPPKPRQPKPPTEREDILDSTGAKVPENLRDVFADRGLSDLIGTLDDINALLTIDAWERKAVALCEHHGFLLIDRFQEHIGEMGKRLELAVDSLRAGLPYAVCPTCQGQDSRREGEVCHGCRGYGAVPQHRFEELTRS